MCSTVTDIRSSFAGLRYDKKLKHREIAEFLEISEAELIDVHVGVSKFDVLRTSPPMPRAIRLDSNWQAIFEASKNLGLVMSVTANDAVVMAQLTQYEGFDSSEGYYLIDCKGLALKLHSTGLKHAFLFEESGSHHMRKSLRLFDEAGFEVHKLHLLPDSEHLAYELIGRTCAKARQVTGIEIPEIVRQRQMAGVRAENDSDLFSQRLSMKDVQALMESAASLKIPLEIILENEVVQATSVRCIHRVIHSEHVLSVIDAGFSLQIDLRKELYFYALSLDSVGQTSASIELYSKQNHRLLTIRPAESAGTSSFVAWRNLIFARQNIQAATMDTQK